MKRLTLAAATAVMLGAMVPSASATFHGENGRISFRRFLNDAETHGAIFTVTSMGTGTVQVTHPHRGFITEEQDWSPTSDWIAYQLKAAETESSRLFKIRPDGSHRKALSTSCIAECLSDRIPAWSPGGSWIAFQRELCSTGSDNLQAIYVMRADGSHPRRVTQQDAKCGRSHRFADLSVQWAPGAKRFAFERADNKRGKRAIFIVRLDGKGLRRLTPWKMDAAQPDWAPGGRWIMFRSQEQSETRGNILLVRPDGSSLHRITHGGGKQKWYSGSFSPDGTKITAARSPGFGKDGKADIFSMERDGSGLRNVTRSEAWEGTPDWGGTPAR
jgi:Tol biopolymer transport system component